MKTFPIALCLLLVAAEAGAVSTYDPTRMGCADVKAVIRQDGEVILRWTSPTAGVPRYGRYVRNSGYCSGRQIAAQTLVPARDKARCGVNNCQVRGDDD